MSDREAAEAVLARIAEMDSGTTHWEGCHSKHIRCAAASAIRGLLEALQRERQAELDACIETVQRIVWGWGWEKQREKGDQLIGVLQRRREEG